MTAPAPRPGPDVAGRLAEALCRCGEMHETGDVRDRLLRVLHSLADEDFDWADADEFAAALLPVVDAIAAERAAEELEALVSWAFALRGPVLVGTASLIAEQARARAAALRGEGR